jgi:hypothetical protein
MALQALLGPGPYVDGLACTPVGGNMQVQIGAGSLYTLAGIDNTSYGSLAADTTDQIVQQGLLFGQTPFTITAPSQAGYSQIFLIEGQYQQVDANPVALQYYNASNPSQPLTGLPTNTVRKAIIALQVKAGIAAPTGTQVAPTADTGWVPLWIVTVANGQLSISAGNIAMAAGAPFIQNKLGGSGFQFYMGNPNGAVAGNAGTAGASFPNVVFDGLNKIWWVCTTTGTASTAVWTSIGASNIGGFYCGTSTGTANAQVITPPSAMQAFNAQNGSIRWIVGAGLTNTGPLNVTVTGFGTFPVRKDGPSGPVALTGGETIAGNVAIGDFDGTYIHLAATDLGTAALANASANTGTVAAIQGSGSITPGHFAVFSDALGTMVDSGASPTTLNGIQISAANNGQTLQPGTYLVDTTGGAFSINLSVTLSGLYTFIDDKNYWTTNNFTVNGNGISIGNVATNVSTTFIANVSDYQFSIVAAGTYWRLI